MPKAGFPLFLLVLGASTAMPADAKPGCPEHLREIKRLYAARDAGLLTVNILEPGCTSKELYQAAYYQGFGFYFVGRYKDALANFQLARGLTGPWDEQILQYIWTIQGRLGDSESQARTLEEFRAEFPKSRKIAEMESAEQRAIKTRFDGLATGGWGWLLGDRTYQGAKSQGLVGGSWTQTRGAHSVSEYLNLAGSLSLEGRRHHFGLEGGVLYRGRSLSAQAELGRIRSAYRAEPGDRLVPVWEWAWTGSLAHSFPRRGGWTWTGSANHLLIGDSFSSLGLTWELERRTGLRTLSLDLTAELQDIGVEGACLAIDQDSKWCESLRSGESLRFAAVEAEWEGGRKAGRHGLGAEARLRYEEGIQSASWRALAVGGLSHGLWMLPGVRLSNVLELGGDWWEGGWEPVVQVGSNVAWLF